MNKTRTRTVAFLISIALTAVGCSDEAEDRETNDNTDASSTSVPETTTTPEQPLPVVDPSALAQPGSYAVGVTTLSLGDRDVEVYYPIDPASAEGRERDVYRQLEIFPQAVQDLLAEVNTEVVIDAFRDVPASDAGPFPVIMFSHGAGGFRKMATFSFVHLASWGFVVTTTDHLERGLLVATGLLEIEPDPAADERDLMAMLDLVGAESAGSTSVLTGVVDARRAVIVGHSAGGFAAVETAELDDRIVGYVSWASGGDAEVTRPSEPALFVVADGDRTIEPARSREFYDALFSARQWVVLDNAGHNSFTDLCAPIYDRGGLADLAATLGLPPALVASAEEGCLPDQNTDPRQLYALLNHTALGFALTTFEVADIGDALEPETLAELFPGLVEASEITPQG